MIKDYDKLTKHNHTKIKDAQKNKNKKQKNVM